MPDFVNRYFLPSDVSGHEQIYGMSYDAGLVVLSIAIAILASFIAFDLVALVRAAPTKVARRAWLITGALSMGCGIWTMHFTGMLALDMESDVHYDLALTVLSLVFGIIASGFAFIFVCRGVKRWPGFLVGGAFLGAGIGAMHYTGMAAMRMQGQIRYDVAILLLSIVVAVVLSSVALGLLHERLKDSQHARLARTVGSAVIMGLSISAMHYTGMAATQFVQGADTTPSGVRLDDSVIIAGIVGIAVFLLVATMVAVTFSSRMRAKEMELEDSENLLRAIVEAANDAIVTIDNQGKIMSFNSAAEATFGCRAYEAIGHCGFESILSKERGTIENYVHHYTSPSPQGQAAAGMEWEGEGQCVDGTVFPAEFSLQKMELAEQPSFLIICRDIRARKKHEAERQRLEIELYQAHKMESLGILAGGIAHEINSPMQFISDNMGFLRDGVDSLTSFLSRQKALVAALESGQGPAAYIDSHAELQRDCDCDYYLEEMPRSIEETLEGINRIREIVQAVQQFSHADEAEKCHADVNKLVADTIVVCRNQWKYVAKVETDFDDDLPSLLCLPGELNQVFLNLIVNAAQAIEEKGLDETGLIHVATRRRDDSIEIRVKDNGTGVTPKHRDRIFDLFFTTKPPGRGTGQGLAICYSIVHQKHGGTITVEGEEGQGATFVVRLPLGQSDSAGEAVAAA